MTDLQRAIATLGMMLTVMCGGLLPGYGKTRVFLLAGQSNMAGHGNANELTGPLASFAVAQTDINIWRSYADETDVGAINAWVPLAPEKGDYYALRNDPGFASQWYPSFGPEVSFGRAIKDAWPGDDLYLIKHAWGATSLASAWDPDGYGSWNSSNTAGAHQDSFGLQYYHFRTAVAAALANLDAASINYEISGMLWMQGESDQGSKATAYEANLTAFIADMRTHYGADLPFIIARINPIWETTGTVRLAQQTVAESTTGVEWFDTDSFPRKGNNTNVHYNTEGQIQLGQGFATSYQTHFETGPGAGPAMGTPSTTALTDVGATVQCQLTGADADVTVVWAHADQGATDVPTWENASGGGSYSFPSTTTAGSTPSYMITGLAGDTEFSYRFFADGTSADSWSAAGAFATGLGNVSAPAALAGSVTNTNVDLTWADSYATETGFVIQRSTDPGFGTVVEFTSPADTPAYTDTTGAPNTTYHYRVAAENAAGVGPFSAGVMMMTGDPAPALANLIAYWDFDSETGGSVPDLSGNGQTGTLNGTSTLTADGGGYTGLAGDRALSFFPDNYFTATSTVSPGAGDWSVSFWYKTAATGTIALVDHSQSPDNTSGYQMFGTTSGGQVALWDDDASSHSAATAGVASGDLDGNTWHHVALSVDRLGADTVTVYIDGSVTDSTSLAALHDFTFGQIQIGTFNGGQVDSTGQIDDYAIFDIALTPSQVAGLANGALTPGTLTGGGPDPVLGTPVASSVTDDGATVQCSLSGADADVTLVWAHTDQGETDVATWLTASGGGSHGFGTTTAGSTLTHTITGLTGDTSFAYRFFADGASADDWSPAGSFATGLGGRPAPPDFGGLSGTSGGATLTWTDSFATETGFVIRRSTDPGFASFVEFTVGADTTSFSDTTTDPNTTYYYIVAAESAAGVGPFSTPVEVTTGGPPPALPNLIAYWDFDSETGGLIADRSGNGQTGDLNGVGATTLTADGGGHTLQPGDRALSYPGGLNYFVATSTVSPGSGSWSVSFWYKTTNTGTHSLTDHSQFPDNTRGYQAFMNGSGGQLAIWDDSNNLATGGGLTTNGDGNWHHVAFTIDQMLGKGNVYVDGIVTDADFDTSALGNITFGQIHLGTFNNGQVSTSGQIDDYAIFDMALTPEQIGGLAGGTLTPDNLAGAADPLVLDIEGSDTGLTFTWNSLPGRTYNIRNSADLSTDPATWNIFAPGATSPHPAPWPASPRMFFALEEIPE